jgi:hypothetical protein
VTPEDKTAAAACGRRAGRRPGRGPGRREMLLAGAGAVVLAAAIAITIVAAGAIHRSGRMASSDMLTGASAGSAPLPVLFAGAAGWHDGQQRPAAIFVGEGGAPLVKDVSWSRWTAAGASAAGRLYMEKPGCTSPAYECPYQQFPVTITLSAARVHAGTRYWSRMQWSYPQDMVQHVISWQFRSGIWQSRG